MVVDMFVLVSLILMIDSLLQEYTTVAIRAQDDALGSAMRTIQNLHLLFVRTSGLGDLSMVAKIMRVPFAKKMKIVGIVKVGICP